MASAAAVSFYTAALMRRCCKRTLRKALTTNDDPKILCKPDKFLGRGFFPDRHDYFLIRANPR